MGNIPIAGIFTRQGLGGLNLAMMTGAMSMMMAKWL